MEGAFVFSGEQWKVSQWPLPHPNHPTGFRPTRVGPAACASGRRQETAIGKRMASFPIQPAKLLLAKFKSAQDKN